jgi:alcohol dehydrogenase
MLRMLGATAIDVVEPEAARRALARSLGARRASAPQEVDASGEAYAVAFECSSRDSAFALAQAALRPGGRLCILADGNMEPLTLTPAFHVKELRAVGSSDGWDYQAHAVWYFEALRRPGCPDLTQVFDLEVRAAALPTIFERLATEPSLAIKVLARY